MTTVNRLLSLRHGINAAVNTFGTVPATMTLPLQPRASVPSLLPRQRTPIDRPLYVVDGRRLPQIQGIKDVGAIDLPLEFKGVSGNTGAAVAAWEAVMEQGTLLASIFGAVGTATSGAATTCSGTAGATLTVVSGTNIPDLSMILFTTTTGTFIRQVVSGGGTTTLTLDRSASGTASGTVVRLGVYSVAPSTTDHKGIWFDAEWTEFRRRYNDCAPSSLKLGFPNSGLVTMDSTWLPNDWSDQAEADPAFSAPTAGNPIVISAATFMIAEVAYMLRNATLTIDNGTQVRETMAGANGVQGAVCADKTNIMLEGELFIGGNSGSIGELVDDSGTPTLDSFLGSDAVAGSAITTRDIALQVGTVAGGCMYLRLPAADFRGQVVEGGAFTVFKFSAMATGSAPLHLGVG